MALSSYPFDNQTTTEAQYSQLFRELQDSGIADTHGGNGFKVGVGTGMDVTVQAGFAILRGHAILSTAVETRTLGASSTATRIDRIVLRLDPAVNAITIEVKPGTDGAGVPPLTQTDTGIFEISLAQVTVGAGVASLAANDVVGDRPFVGSRLRVWTTTSRPANPRRGQLGLNVTSNAWEFYDGAGWAGLVPVVNWETISGKPATFAPSSHRHDWSHLDNIPSSFTPAAHSHSWTGITDKPSTFPPSGHGHLASHTTYGANATPLNQVLDDLYANKSNNGHTHAYVPTNGGTATWSNGSKKPHNYHVSGSGTYYSVWVDGSGVFGRNTSSRKYKCNIRDTDILASDVLALRPRIYDRKDFIGPDGLVVEGRKDEFGLIAEEVVETVPELGIYDENGDLDALRYDLLAVALLKVVQDQDARIKALEARLA